MQTTNTKRIEILRERNRLEKLLLVSYLSKSDKEDIQEKLKDLDKMLSLKTYDRFTVFYQKTIRRYVHKKLECYGVR